MKNIDKSRYYDSIMDYLRPKIDVHENKFDIAEILAEHFFQMRYDDIYERKN